MMIAFEELRILQTAEKMADELWREVIQWDDFAKDVVGKQLTRAVDSIGANIAESFGRYHYGERLQFLYYARGSLFETKYWLNRTLSRKLLSTSVAEVYIEQLTNLARQLNSFAATIKSNRKSAKKIRETTVEYSTANQNETGVSLFNEADLQWLQTISIPNT